ncbi:MAG: amidohydrolase family protein [Gammaproteobacteria bacterium]
MKIPARQSMLFALLLLLPLPLMAQDLLIQNGTVVTAEASFEADLLVQDGVITAIGQDLSAPATTRRVDASGLLVMPGGVDPHVHLGGNWVDDYRTGSMAALAGGITTISNFRSAGQGVDIVEMIEREATVIAQQAIADVILHTTISNAENAVAQMEALAATGQTSIKIFMNFPQFDPNVSTYVEVIEAAGNAGILTMVHAEDLSIIDHQARVLEAAGQTSINYLSDSRPTLAEETAMLRAVAIAEQTGSPMYAVHVSSARALNAAQQARLRGLDFFIETRPIYLHLTRERFASADAGLYVGQPPLRELSDQDALWQGLSNGTIVVVGTDHVAYSREDKLDPAQTIRIHRAGMNHLQMMRPLLFSDGVLKNRITLQQFVAVTATNPAKLFGLFPRKGTVAVGSDADLVLWDADATRTVRDQDMFSATGFTIYDGWEVTGWPVVTVRRGEIVFEDNEIRGAPGSGLLIPRDRWQPR